MKRLVTSFNNWPISRKLTTIVLLASGVLIAVMVVVVSLEKHSSFRGKLVNNSEVLADVIGANASAALVYSDSETAYEMLSALQAEDDVLAAALYNGEGRIFVSYTYPTTRPTAKPQTLPETIGSGAVNSTPLFRDESFDVVQAITLQNEVVGYILLRTDLTQLKQQLLKFFVFIIGVSILLLTAAISICTRLNRTITSPVSQLAQTMENVTETQLFNARVNKIHDDEIGILVDGFNTMLAKIQERDRELENYRHHLEELVKTRTEELQQANDQVINEIKERQEIQAKLAHAEKMEAIGTLAGGVAHDLNNILSGVVTYPDLLLHTLPEDSKLRAPLETIRTSGKKAAAIVNDLLTLARRGAKVKEAVNLQELIEAYLQSPELQELLRHHPQVTIDFIPSDDDFFMLGSPVHLGKAVMNLVTNGIEAMEEGGTLTIELDRTHLTFRPAEFSHWRPGPYLHLSITDTGIGIAQGDLQRIFEPFYSSKSMGKSGTGLGMAVVWGTVEDHKGHITVESKLHEGTTFQLFFPVDPERHRQPETESIDLSSLKGRQQTILVVDDSGEQRRIASELLRHLNYTPTTVASGEEAVAYLKDNTVDLIILDMVMAPGIDGLETYKRILETSPGQRAVIASGFSQSANITEARRLGISAYIMKPYSLVEIGKVLNEIFQDSH